jgi:hypothetical protein
LHLKAIFFHSFALKFSAAGRFFSQKKTGTRIFFHSPYIISKTRSRFNKKSLPKEASPRGGIIEAEEPFGDAGGFSRET